MLARFAGNVMIVTSVQSLNTLSPMLETFFPPSVEGIVTSPLTEELTPVILYELPFTAYDHV